MTRAIGRILCIGLLWLPAASPPRAQGLREVGGAPGAFDFYVLALSWSPGSCALGSDRKGRGQCESGRGLGFVVHGLWPQYERGYPANCNAAERSPSRIALAEADDVFPDEGLARYEWRKHGTCSGKSPADYFRDVRRARDSVRVPDEFSQSSREQSLRAADIERAFAAVNPGLRADMISIACRRGMLQEVRICFEKDLRGFRRCSEVDRSGCGFSPVRVNPVR
jgi:ribonuclease T2